MPGRNNIRRGDLLWLMTSDRDRPSWRESMAVFIMGEGMVVFMRGKHGGLHGGGGMVLFMVVRVSAGDASRHDGPGHRTHAKQEPN